MAKKNKFLDTLNETPEINNMINLLENSHIDTMKKMLEEHYNESREEVPKNKIVEEFFNFILED